MLALSLKSTKNEIFFKSQGYKLAACRTDVALIARSADKLSKVAETIQSETGRSLF